MLIIKFPFFSFYFHFLLFINFHTRWKRMSFFYEDVFISFFFIFQSGSLFFFIRFFAVFVSTLFHISSLFRFFTFNFIAFVVYTSWVIVSLRFYNLIFCLTNILLIYLRFFFVVNASIFEKYHVEEFNYYP